MAWFNIEAIPKSDIKSVIKFDIRFDISIKPTSTWIGHKCTKEIILKGYSTFSCGNKINQLG